MTIWILIFVCLVLTAWCLTHDPDAQNKPSHRKDPR